ncbi:MAG: DUF6273 domain-containing protein [Oscillospiraceae bacterium]|nr:DUF6273 domain-containing protein [Oscillospiraceae bacterium]
MKCGKCKAEWQVDPARSSSITVCPFCQEKIAAEKSSGWKYFDNTKELLEYIAAEYGNDALFGRKYFSDHTAPLMPQGQKNRVKQTFDCGAVKILQDNMTSDQSRKETAVKQAVGKLIDEYGTSKELADKVIWEFTNAIGWGMAEPTGSAQPSGNIVTTSTISKSQSPGKSSAPGVDALMTRAWQFAEDGDWEDAADYFNKALDTDPSFASAFLGLLCVDLRVSKEDKLAKAEKPTDITGHKYYKRAITDPAIKAQLDGYVQTINARIDADKIAVEKAAAKKRIQDVFDDAVKIMDKAQNPDDYRKAITAFSNIDSNYQDINSQIKSKISECEKKMEQMVAELEKTLTPIREKFDPKAKAEKQAKLQEQRKADKEKLDVENAKAKAENEAKCAQIKQKFDADHKAWQEGCNNLYATYSAEYKKWESEASAIKSQSDKWKSQGVCPHCGGTLKGLLSKKCADCGKSPSDTIVLPYQPADPKYPAEPKMPQLPTYTPRKLDESKYKLKEDSASSSNQHITLAGIDWRVLAVENNKLLLISEKILEERLYHDDDEDITWEKCTLRKYLNGEFYNKLGAAKAAIAETRNDNPKNPWYGTNGGNATTDKVFLLSLDEVCRYFGDSTAELRNVRKDAYYFSDKNSANRIAKYGNEADWWWLRSPGGRSIPAASVASDGRVDVRGGGVDLGDSGVRPALWLNL